MRALLFLIAMLHKINKELCTSLNIEHTKTGSIWHTAVYTNTDKNKIISDEVCAASDKSKLKSTIKAVTEWVERQAFLNGFQEKIPSCSTKRSEGFAAYPIFKPFGKKLAQQKSRENALAEAMERWAWLEWWNNRDIAYSILNGKSALDVLPAAAKELLKNIYKHGVSELYLITPMLQVPNSILTIIVVEFSDGGLICGGAAAVNVRELKNTYFRATSECFRHFIALKKYKEHEEMQNLNPDEYINRLLFFATGIGRQLFYDRIRFNGSSAISFPNLEFDEVIPHKYDSYVQVHRCRFIGQPEFIDNHVDRFCI